jgi:hypothetical protein
MAIQIPESMAATLRVIAETPADLARLESVYRLAYAQCQADVINERNARLDAATGTSVPAFLRRQAS